MSLPVLPTPAPSTDLQAKKLSFSSAQIDQAFSLPPAAIYSRNSSSADSSTSSNASDSSYRPISPPPSTSHGSSKPAASARRRSSAANQRTGQYAGSQNGYTLPPPPARSRKIIEMKPRPQQGAPATSPTTAPHKTQASASTPNQSSQSNSKGQVNGTQTTGQKRKQGGAPTTAAGRKIARKTAHSLIERRRRSKMNDEFAVLKDMIPACSGQDMHKLQVLTASIEYMRYLESCLTELKSVHARCAPQNLPITTVPQHPYTSTSSAAGARPISRAMSEDSDEEMSEAASPPSSAAIEHNHPGSSHSLLSHASSMSPAILPSTHTSPALPTHPQRAYSFASHSGFNSNLPSPAFSPQATSGGAGYSTFRLTSPAIEEKPTKGQTTPTAADKDDHEATAALLMLNTDLRSWSGPSGARGMSVRDLLSS